MSRRERMMGDLDQDIRDFIERETQDNIDRGMSPEEARYAALRKFGNVTRVKEETREVWSLVWLEQLWQDVRVGLRQLRRDLPFTAVAVLTLALGIGANTAIFTMVKAMVLHPLPYPNGDRLVWITERETMLNIAGEDIDWGGYVAWKEQAQTIEQVAACLGSLSFNLTGRGAPARVHGEVVSGNFFAMLGVEPRLGRIFTEEEAERGDRVVVLTHAFWQEYFGSHPHVLGQALTLDAAPYTVVGVMPAGFRFPGDSEAQMLLPGGRPGTRREGYADLSGRMLGFIGRLKPGVSIGVARGELAAIRNSAGEIRWAEVELKIVPLADHLGGNLRPAMLVLLGMVCAVLLIACANVANLTLTRAAARTREMAVRTALGASGWRLVRQLRAESVTLALAGGLAGLLLAAWGVNIMVRFIPASAGGNILSLARPHVDATVLLFALVVSSLTGILFGLAPAMAAARPDLVEGLKEGGQWTSGGRRRGWLRGSLGVAELSLALVLLIGAGLLIKSFYRLLSVDPGFAPERVLTMGVTLTETRYPTDQQRHAFFSELLRQVESLPGVRSAALTDSLPLGPYGGLQVAPLHLLAPAAGYAPSAHIFMGRYEVTPGYFRTLGIPLLRGRTFTDQNDKQSVTEVVVSERLASRVWPGEDPVGKTYRIVDQETVVGEVANVRHEGLNQDFQAEIYERCLWRGRDMKLAVRTAVDPASIVPAIRARVKAIDPNQPIYNVATLEQALSDSVTPQRLNVLLLGIFAFIALALAIVGIYGVLAFSVTQRRNEIGIRMALGAGRGDVLRLVVGHGLRLTAVGVIVGLAGAWALTRFLTSFLFGVRPTDLATYVVVSLALALVSLLACYIPARRATKVDPMVALRYE